MYDIEMNKLMYSFYNNNLPVNIQCMFIDNKSIHQHLTRHRNDPHITKRRTAFASDTFMHMAPKNQGSHGFWKCMERYGNELECFPGP